MNIFALDNSPIKSAIYLCDKHVVKMILESTQMLCSAHQYFGDWAPYKLAYPNHPCTIWVRSSLSNYLWLVYHAKTLCIEYGFRYGKTHSCEEIIDWCENNLPPIEDVGLLPFVQAMPEKYKGDNAILAYRRYYLGEKMKFAKWKNGPPRFVLNHIRGGAKFGQLVSRGLALSGTESKGKDIKNKEIMKGGIENEDKNN
jgi:hypothetical protein